MITIENAEDGGVIYFYLRPTIWTLCGFITFSSRFSTTMNTICTNHKIRVCMVVYIGMFTYYMACFLFTYYMFT